MNLIERAKAILLKPADTWPVIEAEPATPASVYKDWLLIMAAIPAVCTFIGMSVIGIGVFGFGYRMPILLGLTSMVMRYVVTLLLVFVMALIVDALAPSFGGTKSRIGALKLIAYGSTASFVAGVFALLPMLGGLAMFAAAIYALYVIWLGLPVLMKCPQDKAAGYLAVTVVIAIVVFIVLGAVLAPFTLGAAWMSGRHGGTGFSIDTPDGQVTVDSDAMQRAAARVAAARERMEAAQKSGDPASAGKALGDMMGALTGAGGSPIPPADLKAQLPETLGALKRDSFETNGGQAMGISSSVAKAGYVGGDQRAQVTISDLGGLGGLASVAQWANVTVDKETSDAIEKVYKEGGRTIHEEYRKDGSHGEVTVILANGVIVETSGDHIDGATIKAMASSLNLDALEAMKRPAKS
ncbi:MAG: Yip1 family protein [Betaproteobacteria bacterium]